MAGYAQLAQRHRTVLSFDDYLQHLDIGNPGDANTRVNIGRQLDSPLRASPELVFDGTTGELLNDKAAATSAPRTVRDTFLGLHEGLFASTALRWLYFMSGLLGTAMIATGMILWTVKRRPAQLKKANGPDFGHRLVESLNLGTIVGLCRAWQPLQQLFQFRFRENAFAALQVNFTFACRNPAFANRAGLANVLDNLSKPYAG